MLVLHAACYFGIKHKENYGFSHSTKKENNILLSVLHERSHLEIIRHATK